MTDTLPLIDYLESLPPAARGQTFDEAKDKLRLCKQGLAVHSILSEGGKQTLEGMTATLRARGLRASTTSISARIREVRRWLEQEGLGTIQTVRVENGNGLHTYELVRG